MDTLSNPVLPVLVNHSLKLLSNFMPSIMFRLTNIKSALQTTFATHHSSSPVPSLPSPTYPFLIIFFIGNTNFYLLLFKVTKIFLYGLHLPTSSWICYPEILLKNPFWGRFIKIYINTSHSLTIHACCCPKLLWNRGNMRTWKRENAKNKIKIWKYISIDVSKHHIITLVYQQETGYTDIKQQL